MALSNWDYITWNTEGEHSNGELTAGSINLNVYKNWLVLHEGKELLAHIDHGQVAIKNFYIEALRHDNQSSIFFHAKHGDQLMAGIGCYGYESQLEWLKENHSSVYNDIQSYVNQGYKTMGCIHSCDSGQYMWGVPLFKYDENEEVVDSIDYVLKMPEPTTDELWTGVTLQTVQEFCKWLPNKDYLKILKTPARFNLNDEYLVDNYDCLIK